MSADVGERILFQRRLWKSRNHDKILYNPLRKQARPTFAGFMGMRARLALSFLLQHSFLFLLASRRLFSWVAVYWRMHILACFSCSCERRKLCNLFFPLAIGQGVQVVDSCMYFQLWKTFSLSDQDRTANNRIRTMYYCSKIGPSSYYCAVWQIFCYFLKRIDINKS